MWFYFHNDVLLVKMYQRMSVIYFYITMMHTFYGLTCLRKQKGEKKREKLKMYHVPTSYWKVFLA